MIIYLWFIFCYLCSFKYVIKSLMIKWWFMYQYLNRYLFHYSCLLIFLWCGVLSVFQWSVKTFISHFLCRLIKDHSKVARWIERKYSSATWNLLCYFPQKLLNKNLLKLRLKTWTGGIVSNRAVNESSQSFSFYLEKAATRTTSLFKVPLQLMTKK